MRLSPCSWHRELVSRTRLGDQLSSSHRAYLPRRSLQGASGPGAADRQGRPSKQRPGPLAFRPGSHHLLAMFLRFHTPSSARIGVQTPVENPAQPGWAQAESKGRDLLRTKYDGDMGLISLPAMILWREYIEGRSTFSFALLIPWIIRYWVFVFAYHFLSLVQKVQGLGPLTSFCLLCIFFSFPGWTIFFVAADRLLFLGITYFSPHAHISSTWVSLSSRPCSSWCRRGRPLPRAPTGHSSPPEPKMGPSRSTHLDIRAKS